MAGRGRVTRELIVEHARRIVAAHGTAGLTFQALAGALGVSKQAIIYWYPNKWELVRDFSLPELKAEADVLIAAVAPATSGAEAMNGFIRTLVAHHLGDLGRFRMLYLAPQFDEHAAVPGADALLAPIHSATSTMYSALADKLAADFGLQWRSGRASPCRGRTHGRYRLHHHGGTGRLNGRSDGAPR